MAIIAITTSSSMSVNARLVGGSCRDNLKEGIDFMASNGLKPDDDVRTQFAIHSPRSQAGIFDNQNELSERGGRGSSVRQGCMLCKGRGWTGIVRPEVQVWLEILFD